MNYSLIRNGAMKNKKMLQGQSAVQKQYFPRVIPKEELLSKNLPMILLKYAPLQLGNTVVDCLPWTVPLKEDVDLKAIEINEKSPGKGFTYWSMHQSDPTCVSRDSRP